MVSRLGRISQPVGFALAQWWSLIFVPGRTWITEAKFATFWHDNRIHTIWKTLRSYLSCHGCKVKGPSSKPWSIMLFTFPSFMLPKESPIPTGFRLPSLSGLHSLTELALSNCNLLEGATLNDLGCLSSLEILNLSENQFVSLPGSICQLSRLVSLDVSNC